MGKWAIKKLWEVADFTMGQSPDSETYNFDGNGMPFFQGKTDFGLVHPTIRAFCTDPKKTAKENDILISVRAPVGAVNIATENCCIGRGLAAISQRERTSFYKYLYYYLSYKQKDIEKMGVGSTFTAISRKDLDSIEIPLPPLPIQQKIADALDKASALIEMRKAQIEKLDLLVKSQFIEMFGDPVTNPKGWETMPLAETGTFKNGINFGSNESGASLYCLGVGDFGDKMTIDNIERLSRVFLDKKPSLEHLLRDGDVVFVRSNGNKELVGRCVAVYPGRHETTFSGFCIRYRKTLDSLLIEYLLQVLKASSTRYKMIGRGANIQNLNQQLLSQLVIPIPPILLQQKFASTTSKMVEMKRQIEESLNALELFYKSLVQRCFSGEMF